MQGHIQHCSVCEGIMPTWIYSEREGWQGMYIEGAFWCACDSSYEYDMPSPIENESI